MKNKLVEHEGMFLNRFGRIYIAEDPALRKTLLEARHDDRLAGHRGTRRTLELLQRKFVWEHMRADVLHYVASCASCQRHKSERRRQAGLLQPLEVPERFWAHVSLDFITCLPKTPRGHDALIVFVDKLSKIVVLHPCDLIHT